MLTTSTRAFGILCIALLFAAGCTPQGDSGESADTATSGTMTQSASVDSAVAILQPTQGNQAAGTVTFTGTPEGVRVQGSLTGLSSGEHGFHVHRYGDCRAADGTSAGGHYNPADTSHGAPDDAERHMGDMGNITATEGGTAQIDFTDSRLSLDGPNSIMGRGVILHAGADDFTSQPSGAAGARIACGEIGIANPGM
ncbi:MAG: superoxide dismutase family protein [Balneolaceae bacterium]|nr:superoxide dismutase family protein [Balneolaceae bacterium]